MSWTKIGCSASYIEPISRTRPVLDSSKKLRQARLDIIAPQLGNLLVHFDKKQLAVDGPKPSGTATVSGYHVHNSAEKCPQGLVPGVNREETCGWNRCRNNCRRVC
jgi:hypothetical protein